MGDVVDMGLQTWRLTCPCPPLPSLPLACDSEVSDPAVVAPVAGTAPPQRLGLWPADLARLWVLFTFKLWGRAAPHAPGGGGLVGPRR